MPQEELYNDTFCKIIQPKEFCEGGNLPIFGKELHRVCLHKFLDTVYSIKVVMCALKPVIYPHVVHRDF